MMVQKGECIFTPCFPQGDGIGFTDLHNGLEGIFFSLLTSLSDLSGKWLFFFLACFTSPASSGNRYVWQSSSDQRQGDRLLPLHEQERQASGEGKCFLLIRR